MITIQNAKRPKYKHGPAKRPLTIVKLSELPVPPPNPQVYLLAAKYVEDKDTRSVKHAIIRGYMQIYNTAPISIINRYYEQYKIGFLLFPWWSKIINKTNRKLHVSALYMMASTCKVARIKL